MPAQWRSSSGVDSGIGTPRGELWAHDAQLVSAKSQKERNHLYHFGTHLRPGELSLCNVGKKKVLLPQTKQEGACVRIGPEAPVEKAQWGRPT